MAKCKAFENHFLSNVEFDLDLTFDTSIGYNINMR